MTIERTENIDQAATYSEDFEANLMAEVSATLARHPVVGLAVGVVRDGDLDFFHGHGVADISSGAPITEDTMFRIASITKTFTAIAVMQLWEEDLVDLDAPVNEYLRSFHLIPARAGLGQPTLRHLLTHTAGLAELGRASGLVLPDFGESVEAGAPLPTLAEFYNGELRFHAEPGARFVYGNHSPATLGQLVEDVSGLTLDRYFTENIFEPLGMTESDLRRIHPIKSRLATGYEIGSRAIRRVTERDMVTTGAASIYSTPRDMARYLAALLGGGRNTFGTVLRPATLAMMFEPQYQPDPRIPGMGLGFFRTRVGDQIAVGHQGSHPGFHSQILAVPQAGCAVMMFTNGASHSDLWLPSEASHVLSRCLESVPTRSRTPISQRPDLWEDLVGWYELPARLSDIRLRSMIGAGVEVFLHAGTLKIRFLTPIAELARGFSLHPDDPDDPYVFRIELPESGLDAMRMVFGQDADGRTSCVHLDLMPLTLHKRPAATNPRRWAAGTVAAGLVLAIARAALGATR